MTQAIQFNFYFGLNAQTTLLINPNIDFFLIFIDLLQSPICFFLVCIFAFSQTTDFKIAHI